MLIVVLHESRVPMSPGMSCDEKSWLMPIRVLKA